MPRAKMEIQSHAILERSFRFDIRVGNGMDAKPEIEKLLRKNRGHSKGAGYDKKTFFVLKNRSHFVEPETRDRNGRR